MDIKNTNLNRQEKINIIKILQNGDLKLSGQAIRGSNSTFLCDVSFGYQSIQAIYKPSKGEQPLWDFPHFTLAQREVAAYIVSEILGWNLVPPTVLRTKTAVFGIGSLQYFIDHNPTLHYLNNSSIDVYTIMKVITFDMLINNADRKSGHVLFDKNKNIWLIDHGLCFNKDKKLRTVIWDYAGQPIPNRIKNEINNFNEKLEISKLRLVKKLKMLMSKDEFLTIIERGKDIITMDVFPHSEPNRRSIPWPPI